MHANMVRLLFGFPVAPGVGSTREKTEFAENYIRSHNLDLRIRRENGKVIVRTQTSRYVDMEWTNVCNARCTFCPREKMKAVGHMQERVFEATIEKIRRGPIGKIMCIGRGEPLLHPKATEFVEHIKRYTGVSLEIFTNGEILTPALIDKLAEINDEILNLRINVSLHTLQRDLHREMVGVDFDKVISNLRYLIKKSDRIGYSVCFVLNKTNEEEMRQLAEHFQQRGIPKTGISLVYNKGGHVANGKVFDSDFYRRVFAPKPGDKLPEPRLCEYTYDHLAYSINYRGEFTICHDDFDDMYRLGSVLEDDFSSIDEKVEQLRRAGGTEQCRSCTKYLREAQHGREVMAKSEIVL